MVAQQRRGAAPRPAATQPGQRRRALVCVPSIDDVVGAGGVAPRWRTYLRELAADGWELELWTVDSADAARRIPRCVHPFFPRTLTDAPSVAWMWHLGFALRHRRPDVIVVTDLFNDVNVAFLASALGVPLLYSLHTDGSKLPGGVPALASLAQALTSRLAERTVTTSPSFARVLVERGVCRKRDVSYYAPLSCTDLAAATVSEEDLAAARAALLGGGPGGGAADHHHHHHHHQHRPIVLYCGRWSAEKRIDLLVRVRRESKRTWTLAIVGDAADDRVAADVERWHAPPEVVVLRGMVERGPSLAAYYRAADWVASASDFETFGNVAHEAACCGTPAILQRGPGFVDQIPERLHQGKPVPSDRGALVDYGALDSAAQFDAAFDRTRHLLEVPHRVVGAANAFSANGHTVSTLFALAAATPKKAPPLPARCAALAACFATAALLRLFVASYALYLRAGLLVSKVVPPLFRRLRPPARRRRWAGSVRFLTGSLGGIFRSGLSDWKRAPSQPMFEILRSTNDQDTDRAR